MSKLLRSRGITLGKLSPTVNSLHSVHVTCHQSNATPQLDRCSALVGAIVLIMIRLTDLLPRHYRSASHRLCLNMSLNSMLANFLIDYRIMDGAAPHARTTPDLRGASMLNLLVLSSGLLAAPLSSPTALLGEENTLGGAISPGRRDDHQGRIIRRHLLNALRSNESACNVSPFWKVVNYFSARYEPVQATVCGWMMSWDKINPNFCHLRWCIKS